MLFLCAAADVPLGGCKRIGRGRLSAIAVFNLAGRFYATDDKCTHGAASLSAGDIEDGQVICPLHFGAFDIATGAPTEPPCDTALATYPVTVADGGLYIDEEA
jgi:nitrite reductase/ring-hydroxylating ferredoxin subunit